LVWEGLRRAPEGGVWALVSDAPAGRAIEQRSSRLEELDRPTVLVGSIDCLDALLEERGDRDVRFDRVLARNLVTSRPGLPALPTVEELETVRAVLSDGGRLCLAQTIPRHGQRLCDLIDWPAELSALRARARAVEEGIFSDTDDPLVSWSERDVASRLEEAGFDVVTMEVEELDTPKRITPDLLDAWFAEQEGPRGQLRYGGRLRGAGLTDEDIGRVRALYRAQLAGRTVSWKSLVAFLCASSTGG
jgi:putative ATPase